VLLYKELDADDGELTRTRKVRRGVIAEKYGSIIDALYSDTALSTSIPGFISRTVPGSAS
jgi:long-subunit acyl-CoA synthetase (AMP-forming)